MGDIQPVKKKSILSHLVRSFFSLRQLDYTCKEHSEIEFMSSRIFRWFNKFRKRKSRQKNGQYTLPDVIIKSEEGFDPKRDYQALAERVEVLERTFQVSQNPIEKLEFAAEVLNALPTVVRKTIDGIIFNYNHDFADFCFLGMRKALIDSIRIRFQMDNKEDLLYDKQGDTYKLPKWIELAKQRRYISKNIADNLKRVKIFGDAASHDYMANLQKEEVPPILDILRIALSRMFYSE